jgi:NUMOD4 motif/HNH endonuclease
MSEVWEEVNGFPRYLVSSIGRIQNRITNRFLKPSIDRDGYLYVDLYFDGLSYRRKIHRLIADAFFYDDHEDLEVNHNDGNKSNNFIGNLEWTTHGGNVRHAYATGLNKGRVKGHSIRIIETQEVFPSERACARAIGGKQSSVWACLNGNQKSHRGFTFEFVD